MTKYLLFNRYNHQVNNFTEINSFNSINSDI